MIKFNKGFFILAGILIVIGYTQQFLSVLFFVILHEGGHIGAAYLLGARLKTLKITPLGPIGIIEDFEKLCSGKKIKILLAGPFVNLIFIGIFSFWPNSFYLQGFFLQINIALLLFNMLPVYPLDGGRILLALISKKMGLIRGNALLLKIGGLTNTMIFILGLVQIILFPFNASLLCLGLYIKKAAAHHYQEMSVSFYKIILAGYKSVDIICPNHMVVKTTMPLARIMGRFDQESYTISYVKTHQGIVGPIYEEEILKGISQGNAYTMGDLLKDINKQ